MELTTPTINKAVQQIKSLADLGLFLPEEFRELKRRIKGITIEPIEVKVTEGEDELINRADFGKMLGFTYKTIKKLEKERKVFPDESAKKYTNKVKYSKSKCQYFKDNGVWPE